MVRRAGRARPGPRCECVHGGQLPPASVQAKKGFRQLCGGVGECSRFPLRNGKALERADMRFRELGNTCVFGLQWIREHSIATFALGAIQIAVCNVEKLRVGGDLAGEGCGYADAHCDADRTCASLD